MIKVALVTSTFPSIGQFYVFEWATALRQAGVEITILTENISEEGLATAGDMQSQWARRICQMNRLDHLSKSMPATVPQMFSLASSPYKSFKSLLFLKRLSKTSTFFRRAFEYLPIMNLSFDLVHFNAPQIAIRRFELGKLLHGRSLVSFRGQDFSFDRDRYDGLLREADHLHFISEHLLREAGKRGYSGNKHTLIPPMVDIDFYQPRRKPSSPEARNHFVLFSAARFYWSKGWEFALQAFAILVQRGWDVCYEIAGEGGFGGANEYKSAILYTIRELGLQDRVTLLGWLSPFELKSKMQESDLYVLASVEEGFNNSVVQAQACGVPVVCSDAGGLPENIEDGLTGLLFRRRDAWDMADKIERLLANPDLRVSMGQAGRQRAERCFSMQTGVEAFLGLYQSLAE